MTFLSRLLQSAPPPLAALWDRIVAVARQEHWYRDHAVPDTLDGRFDMVVLVTALVLLRLEAEAKGQEAAWLTERFVADMDGSLRDIGVGDLVIGRQMGQVLGALGGRLGAYRNALAPDAPPDALVEALARNVWRGAAPPGAAADLAQAVRALDAAVRAVPLVDILEGRAP
jgi:cytochrome b pre-mRNA-processing protein 3